MSLVFLPDQSAFFLSRSAEDAGRVAELLGRGTDYVAGLIGPSGRRARVSGTRLPLLETVARLAVVPAYELELLPASVATWTLACKLALDLIARERIVPVLRARADGAEARWSIALSNADDATQVAALARSLPPAAHAVALTGSDRRANAWAPQAVLRAFLDATADALVRAGSAGREGDATRAAAAAARAPHKSGAASGGWSQRWLNALVQSDSTFDPRGLAERHLVEDLERWSAPALATTDRLRACFRLELPEREEAPFVLRFLLQSPDDPSLLVLAQEIWRGDTKRLAELGQAFRDPQESLLEALGRAARLFPPLERSLQEATPDHLELDAAAAWQFLSEGTRLLAQAGFGVIVPGELTAVGQRRLRIRMRVGTTSRVAGAVAASGLALGHLVQFEWQAAIGDEPLSERELIALANQKSALVRHRGAWVAIDPQELEGIRARLSAGPVQLATAEALRAALAGETRIGDFVAPVLAEGGFARVLERLRSADHTALPAPRGLRATLRPYQARGLAWLATMSSLGLGACLADDMGLGKTVQMLAWLLHLFETTPDEVRPALLVAPTSVVGNWEREISRFAPDLRVIRHYGSDRARSADAFPRTAGTLVVTSYGLLRRDRELLAGIEWSVAVLDEAQNIKNAASATARAARALEATYRFVLTGTPIENRLAELWSLLEFANPGLLGPLETFRREYAVPIERYGNEVAAARLKRIVGPFLLRRLKSDPAVIQDLPAKNEMKVVCTLTREQATLYQAVVNEELRSIESAEGIERRGRVLALLMFLKQICNHPAHYLGEAKPLAGRSGKLARLTEMLEEAIADGDRALVFTQFREMGERLVTHLEASLRTEVQYLHGGTAKSARDRMVERFQEDPHGPRIFVLSLKAGGTGLNLTAATHVFHYDRWWNPAVEDQATDRAYRIGQHRAVQVHKLMCGGTVEEKVDELLERKRDLAARIVGTGEQWITDLDDRALRELCALSADAAVGSEEAEEEGAPAAPDLRALGDARSRRKVRA